MTYTPEEVAKACAIVSAMSNDEFFKAATKLGLDVGSAMPKYRGPLPYWWEGDYGHRHSKQDHTGEGKSDGHTD